MPHDRTTELMLGKLRDLERDVDVLNRTKPIPTVTALPDAGNAGRVVYLSGDRQLYKDNGTKWELLSLNSVVNAKGDLLVGTADDTVTRKAVGVNGSQLVANSGFADGMEWKTGPSSQTIGYRTDTAQSGSALIPNGQWHPLAFNVHDHLVGNQTFNTDVMNSLGNYIQVNEAGYYKVSCSVASSNPGANIRIAVAAYRHRDGIHVVEQLAHQLSGMGEVTVSGSTVAYLQAGDRLSLRRLWDRQTGNHSIYSDSGSIRFNYLSVARVRFA